MSLETFATLAPETTDSPRSLLAKLTFALAGRYVTPQQYGAVADGVTNDAVAIQAAFDNADGYPVFIPPGIYLASDLLTIPAAVHVYGAGPLMSIIKSDRSAETAAISAEGGNRVAWLQIQGTSATVANSTTWDLGSRQFRIIGNDVFIEGVTLTNVARGFSVENCSRVQIIGCTVSNCQSRYGTASAYHVSGGTDVSILDCYAYSAQRIVEIEDGSSNVTVDGFVAVDCCGAKYATAPAYGTGATDYYNIPYGLDVHNHTATGACRNITFRNCRLSNCGQLIRIVQDSANEVSNVVFDTILFDGANDSWANSTSARLIHFSGGKNITTRNVVVRGTATNFDELCLIDAGAGSSVSGLELDLRVESVKTKAVYCNDAAARNIRVRGGRYSYTVSTGSFGIELIAGKGHVVSGNQFINVKGHSSGIVAMGVEGGRVESNHFEWDATGTNPPTVINLRANGTAANGNTFDGGASLTNGYIRVSNNADQFSILDNEFVGAGAYTFIKIETGSDNGLYSRNRANQVSGVTDAGTGNVSSRNMWNAAPSAA